MCAPQVNEDTGSILVRCWRASAVARWWRETAPLRNPFSTSRGIRLCGIPWLWLVLVFLLIGLGRLTGIWTCFLGAAVFAGAYCFPITALALIPSALIFSPRFTLFAMGDEALFWRLDHMLVAGLFFYCCRRRCFRPSGLHLPFLILGGVLMGSVFAGYFQGTLSSPAASLFYLIHWLHLFMVFVVAHALGRSLGNQGVYAWALPVIAAAAWGIAESCWPMAALPEVRYRCYERVFFDGQANHFAGLFVAAVAIGAPLLSAPRWRILAALLGILSLWGLMTTGSRTGMIALLALPGAWLWLRFPRLRIVFFLGGLLSLLLIPEAIWYRLSAPGSSMFDRLVAWKSALSTVPAFPVLGIGLGARHRSFYDSHYFMTLAESGLLGLLALLYWQATFLRALAQRAAATGIQGRLALGAWLAFAGLSVHGLAAVSFIITLLAGPLLWWCGYVLAMAEEA